MHPAGFPPDTSSPLARPSDSQRAVGQPVRPHSARWRRLPLQRLPPRTRMHTPPLLPHHKRSPQQRSPPNERPSPLSSRHIAGAHTFASAVLASTPAAPRLPRLPPKQQSPSLRAENGRGCACQTHRRADSAAGRKLGSPLRGDENEPADGSIEEEEGVDGKGLAVGRHKLAHEA